MSKTTTDSVEISLKDCLFFILKKVVVLIIAAVIFAGLAIVYKVLNSNMSTELVGVLNTDSRLPDETDEEYRNRVIKVNRAQDLMMSIELYNNQLDSLFEYTSSSVLFGLDASNVAHSEAQILVSLENESDYGSCGALCSGYKYDIESGIYLESLSRNLDSSSDLLVELIRYEDNRYEDNNEDIVIYQNESNRVFNVEVVGPNTEFTDAVLDCVLDEIMSKSEAFSASIAEHTISVIGRQNYVSFDNYVNSSQLSIQSNIDTLHNKINSCYNSLDALAKQLGLADRNSFYVVNGNNRDYSLLVYSIAGVLFGIVIVSCYYLVVYLYGKKILTQRQFFCCFSNIVKIGVCKPLRKKSLFIQKMDLVTEDDCLISLEMNNKIIAANLKNITADKKNILITGSANEEASINLIKDLGIEADIKMNLFSNPDILKSISNYDAVVLLEQRGLSEKRAIEREIELINNASIPIAGAIII